MEDKIFQQWYEYIVKNLIPVIQSNTLFLEGNILNCGTCGKESWPVDSILQYMNTVDENFAGKRNNISVSASQSNIVDVFEIGFNSGFSTALMLISNPNIKITCVDIGWHKYVVPCYQVLKRDFGDRINLIVGDSRVVVPTISGAFDLIHIDGARQEHIAREDIDNCMRLCKKGTVIIMDDTDLTCLYNLWYSKVKEYNLIDVNFEIQKTDRHDIKIFSNTKSKKVAFLSNKLTLRGAEVAMYDYAHYNETILGNSSIIITRDYEDCKNEMDTHIRAYKKFEERFPMFHYRNIQDIEAIIEREQIDWLYVIKFGHKTDGLITNKCKTLIHCVFESNDKHGTVYTPISEFINQKFKTSYPVLPHMISLPENNHNLRKVLNIPENALVFGGYGGATSFDIPYIHKAIYDTAKNNPNIYFVFATFPQFCPYLDNIIHLPPIVKLEDKVSFINTCDAMVYGRSRGETFGLACGEFSIKNKIVICSTSVYYENFHLSVLKDACITHSSYEEIYEILNNWSEHKNKVSEETLLNNGYKNYTPEKVMNIFNSLIN